MGWSLWPDWEAKGKREENNNKSIKQNTDQSQVNAESRAAKRTTGTLATPPLVEGPTKRPKVDPNDSRTLLLSPWQYPGKK